MTYNWYYITSTCIIRSIFIVSHLRLFDISVTYFLHYYIFLIFVTATVLYYRATRDVATNFTGICSRHCGRRRDKRTDHSEWQYSTSTVSKIIKLRYDILSMSRYGQITIFLNYYVEPGVSSICLIDYSTGTQ
jgi:hypothetical protein